MTEGGGHRRGRKHIRAQTTDMELKASPDRRETTTGILRLDLGKPRRSSGGSVDFRGVPDRLGPQGEPPSPQPSVDRLSVTFAEKSDCSESSVKVNIFDPGSPPAVLHDMDKVRFSRDQAGTDVEDEEDDDYSASVSAIIQRRESTRRTSSKRRKRRPSSPFSTCDVDSGLSDGRRRSSVFTNSSGDVGESAEEGTTQEQIFENIRLHKEVLGSVKLQPWNMRRKIKLVQQAKSYVKRHEGELQERLAMSKSTRDIVARFNILLIKFFRRELANTMTVLIPWELRIKEIESHFGSAVASYFTFLRWMFWVNLVITIVLACFVAIPEILTADAANDGERKVLLPDEKRVATNLLTLWDFEGILKYSPIFYGYYTNRDKHTGYRLPFAYFMTGLAVYVYSFVATLRRMAENSRMSKLSEKDDECAFTWKLFSGWDYMIGNAETAHNRVASLILGFKESLLEETERQKEKKSWKVIALRVLVNFLVLSLLVFSAYIIFIVVERSTTPEGESTWWRQNEITVSLSIISLIFPIFFEVLGLLEGYHPRKCLRVQLARFVNSLFRGPRCAEEECLQRIMVLNLLNLYTLIFSLFWKISDKAAELKALKEKYKIPEPKTFETTSISSGMTTTVAGFFEPTAVTQTCFREIVDCSTLFDNPISSTLVAAAVANITITSLLPLLLTSTSRSSTSSTSTVSSPGEDDTTTNTTLDVNETDWTSTSWAGGLEQFELKVTPTDSTMITSTEPPGSLEELESITEPPSSVLPGGGGRTSSAFPSLFTAIADILRSSVVPILTNVTSARRVTSTSTESSEELTTKQDDSTTSEATSTESPTPCYVTRCEVIPTESENMSSVTESSTGLVNTNKIPELDLETRSKLRKLCWETMFGQELVKLTVMDLVLTVFSILLVDFFRAVFVRVMNNCWCWDLEKKFPQYGDFKIAENILHLVNNQGLVWMGMFFSPGLPAINLVKLAIMMYLRSWAVLTCNVPHEVVFKASRSNNFYLALLLTMLFLCVLPVGFAIVWIEPSWHCGPFSDYAKIYHLFTKTLQRWLPKSLHKALDYVASPGIIIPLLMLLVLIIYYLVSLTNSLREANNDLKVQLRRERTEERRKMFQLVDKRARKGSGESETPFAKWKKLLPDLSPKPPCSVPDVEKGQREKLENGNVGAKKDNRKELLNRLMKKALRKSSGTSDEDSPLPDDGTDGEQVDSLFEDGAKTKNSKKKKKHGKETEPAPKCSSHKVANVSYEKERKRKPTSVTSTQRNSLGSDWSEAIPVIKISKTESEECIKQSKEEHGRGIRRFKELVAKQIAKQRKSKEAMRNKAQEMKPIKKTTETDQEKEEAKRRLKEKLKKLGSKSKGTKNTEAKEKAGKPEQPMEEERRCPMATAETVSSDLDMSLVSLKTDADKRTSAVTSVEE